MSRGDAQTQAGASLGYVLLLGAVTMFSLSLNIEALGIGSNADPGPRFFPVILSAALALAGAIEIGKYIRGKRAIVSAKASDDGSVTARRLRVTGLLTLFLAYIIALPWLGFAVSTLLLATIMLRALSVSWKMTGAVSVVLVLIVYLLFGLLFRVPLPTGVFGMPF